MNDNDLRGESLEQWFCEKLKSGGWGERMIALHLISKGWTIIATSGGSEWDIKAVKRIEATFEVKTNYYEYKNFRHPMAIIETESNGVPSGLSVTEADFYVLYYPFEDFFFIERTCDIKAMIASGLYEKVRGGRKDLAVMYQIPRAAFLNKKQLRFMDYLDEDTKRQEWWEWYSLFRGGS